MSDEGDNNFVRYIYRGAEDEHIPEDATYVIMGEDVTVVRRRAFYRHDNIVEVICHDRVETIEEGAFGDCFCLRRVIMPGVKIVEGWAFNGCEDLTEVECGKLERVGKGVFGRCKSLRSIHLPSIKIVKGYAFAACDALMDVKFGNKLGRMEDGVFSLCRSLERITIPLKDGMMSDDTFKGCENLSHVDLVEGDLHETIVALHMEDWRNDMDDEIDSINQILPYSPSGGKWDHNISDYSAGEKARAIRMWIRSLLGKINRYQAEHQRLLDEEVATALELILSAEIVIINVLPFLALPSHTFEMEDEEDDASDQEEYRGNL